MTLAPSSSSRRLLGEPGHVFVGDCQKSRDAGIASDLDLRQAQTQVETARAALAAFAGHIATDRATRCSAEGPDQAAASRRITSQSASTSARSVGSAPMLTRTIQRPSRVAGVR